MDSLVRVVEATKYTAHRAIRSHAPIRTTNQDRRSATATATTRLHSVAVRAQTTDLRSDHVALSEAVEATEARRSVAARAQTAEAETAMAAEATAHSEAVANTTLSNTIQQQNI